MTEYEAMKAEIARLQDERDEWKDKFETADQVVKDYRAAFGLKDGQSGYDMLEIHKYALGQLKDTQVDAREMAKALSHWIMFPSETNTEGLFDAFHQHGTQYIA
jgi:hypothetical protein